MWWREAAASYGLNVCFDDPANTCSTGDAGILIVRAAVPEGWQKNQKREGSAWLRYAEEAESWRFDRHR